MALMVLIDKITHALESGKHVIGIFFYFSKAFDTVDHAILLDKLYHYAIRGTALQWFQSYLHERKQYVIYNSVQSKHTPIKCSVP